MTKIAINGIGRIGKLVLKSLIEHGLDGEIVLLNDSIGTPEQHALWLEFDTVHGRWPATFAHDTNSVTVNGSEMRFTHFSKPSDLPLKALGIDIVIDCTGVFSTPPKVQPYFDSGVSKVIVSSPIRKNPALNLVYGVNHDLYDPDVHHLITGTCSVTNALAPIVSIIHEEFEITHGSVTAIQNATNTQVIVDRPGKDPRRARSGANSLVPSDIGSTSAISLIYPKLEGLLSGHSVRVPAQNASLIDCVFEVTHETTADEVNSLFQEYAAGPLRGIMGYEERPLVSADYLNDPRSCIIDAPSTLVVNGTQVKAFAWYDNEWAYSCRLADITRMVAKQM